MWVREEYSWMFGEFGDLLLFLYGIIPTIQPSNFGRVYAAYGGIFVVMAIIWGLIIEKKGLIHMKSFVVDCNHERFNNDSLSKVTIFKSVILFVVIGHDNKMCDDCGCNPRDCKRDKCPDCLIGFCCFLHFQD